MDEKVIATYTMMLLKREGLNYETAAVRCKTSASTIKNLCLEKTSNPGVFTLHSIFEPLNGSVDEMLGLSPKPQNTSEQSFANAIKELSEHQLKINETHINNIRAHYERQHEENDKHHVEIVKLKDEQNAMLKKALVAVCLVAGVAVSVLIGLLILEVMNPDLGWLRF